MNGSRGAAAAQSAQNAGDPDPALPFGSLASAGVGEQDASWVGLTCTGAGISELSPRSTVCGEEDATTVSAAATPAGHPEAGSSPGTPVRRSQDLWGHTAIRRAPS